MERELPGRGPAVTGTLDQPPDQREQRAGQERDTGDVERGGRPGGRCLPEHEQAHEQGGQAHRDVDVEAVLPAHVLDQQPAHDRPGRGGGADDRAPDADGTVQLLLRERVAEQRERGRHQHRPEHALGQPERDDQADAGGDGAGQADGRRAQREPGHADQEDLLMPEPVAELAHGDQADRQGEQVGVGDPLDASQ